MSARKYGWKPDVPDFRDHVVSEDGPFLRAPYLPKEVDSRGWCSKVEDQLQTNSCVGNAIVGALELLENKANKGFVDLSRLFVYWNARDQEGTTDKDGGCFIRDGVKAAASLGSCAESLWPFDASTITTPPPQSVYDDAFSHRITEYARVPQTTQHVKSVLAGGFPIVFGMSVYDSFESDTVAATGVVPLPVHGETLQGGHAVLAVGYSDAKQCILVRNSWGEGWGLGGYFWLPYEFFFNYNLVDDIWTIRR